MENPHDPHLQSHHPLRNDYMHKFVVVKYIIDFLLHSFDASSNPIKYAQNKCK